MALSPSLVASLSIMHPPEIVAMLQDRTWPKGGGPLSLQNEVRPVDLFCYLGARFGPPNGIQNVLRGDHSDNLIHWEWTLRHPEGVVTFQGHNFRSEVWFHGFAVPEERDRNDLAAQLKADFPRLGKQMKQVRERLEHWTEFVNPHQRIRRAVTRLIGELDALALDPEANRIDDIWALSDERARQQWTETADRYAKGFSLSFAIRSMLPVLAESYINFVLFAMMRPELRADDRLRENAIRQPIDVRIRSLMLNCTGFRQQPDYSSTACANYHRLVNERNDLLHGNVAVDRLVFNEVYFLGRVPVFREYRTFWQRTLDIEMKAVGLEAVREELAVVESFIGYIASCMDERPRHDMELLVNEYTLGLNRATHRLGILFPAHLVDSRLGPTREEPSTVVSESDASPA